MTQITGVLCAVILTLFVGQVAGADEPPNPLDKVPSRFTKLDEIRVHYKSLGEGAKALVFVHGWTCDMNVWRYQVPAFDGKVRMILIDLPGHGQSDKPRIDYTMDLFARAVNAVLKDAGVAKAVLAGHSMGTPVIRQFYRLFPEQTIALVAVDGALRPFLDKPEDIEKFVDRFRGPDFKEKVGKMVDGMVAPLAPKAVRKQIHESMPTAPEYVGVSAMKGMLDLAIWKEDEIKVPVLALMANNPRWSEDYKVYVRNLAPQIDYRGIAGVGHFLMMEKAQQINDLIAGFVKKQGLIREGA
jgi:pimeloyl-ACP methyl ester carboxylesterase